MKMKPVLLRALSNWTPLPETSDDELIAYVLAFFLVQNARGRDMDIYKVLAGEFVTREKAYRDYREEDEVPSPIPHIRYTSKSFGVMTPFGIEQGEMDRIRERIERVESTVLNCMHSQDLVISRSALKREMSDETCIDMAIAFRVGLRLQDRDPLFEREPLAAIAEIERRALPTR
jgi:hypothetical protein